MRDKLGQLVQKLASPPGGNKVPRFILNVICTAIAYFSMHAYPYWETMIEDLTNILSGGDDQAICLLSTLTYMANECDNDSIIIEDSIRHHYYSYLDAHARIHVFKNMNSCFYKSENTISCFQNSENMS